MNYIGEQGYARNLDNLMVIEKSGLGKLPIVDITELQMNLFLRRLTRYSESVIKKIYQQVKAAYRIAKDKNIVENNLMESTTIRRPRSSKKEKVVKGFTQEEQTRFIDVLNDFKVPRNRNDYKLQLLIELYSGMRMGEINALRTEDIDLENGLVHVRATISRGLEYRNFIKDGAKTDAGVRDIPVNKALESVLKEALERVQNNPFDLIFYDYLKKDLITTS